MMGTFVSLLVLLVATLSLFTDGDRDLMEGELLGCDVVVKIFLSVLELFNCYYFYAYFIKKKKIFGKIACLEESSRGLGISDATAVFTSGKNLSPFESFLTVLQKIKK